MYNISPTTSLLCFFSSANTLFMLALFRYCTIPLGLHSALLNITAAYFLDFADVKKENVCSGLVFFFPPVHFCEYSALSILCRASAWSLPRTEAGISGVSCQLGGYKGSEAWGKIQQASEEGNPVLLMCITVLRDPFPQKQILQGHCGQVSKMFTELILFSCEGQRGSPSTS